MGYIYVLNHQSFEENVYKIGRTKNLMGRLTQYNVGSPHKYEYVYTHETIDEVECEHEVHKRLNKYQICAREFFKVHLTKIIRVIEDVCLNYTNSKQINNSVIKNINKKKHNNAKINHIPKSYDHLLIEFLSELTKYKSLNSEDINCLVHLFNKQINTRFEKEINDKVIDVAFYDNLPAEHMDKVINHLHQTLQTKYPDRYEKQL